MPENPMPFKAGDEWHPERSGGNPSLLPDTTGFSPWSGSFLVLLFFPHSLQDEISIKVIISLIKFPLQTF